mgnify:CR=1 FL=1
MLTSVALRKESVDRNSTGLASSRACIMSLSARRAWIEMEHPQHKLVSMLKSLSARRAWIEIPIVPAELVTLVSLSARRAWIEI